METYAQPINFDQIWQLFQETDKRFKETNKKIKELSSLFITQWGKLVELLVEGDLVKLLKGRGIAVEKTLQRVKGNKDGENYEYDIIAVNGHEIVIVEVKTTLRVDDVNDFHEKLWKVKRYMPEYKEKKIFGGAAFIISEVASDRMAEKLGFFAIRATGNSSSIINPKNFKPKVFYYEEIMGLPLIKNETGKWISP